MTGGHGIRVLRCFGTRGGAIDRRVRWLIACLLVAVVALLTGAAGAPAAHGARAAGFERCCFELDVTESSYLGAEYPCNCGSGQTRYPYGGHFFKVTWGGHEIVSYHEGPTGTPVLGEVFAGQARILVTATDSSSFKLSGNANDARSCAYVRSTLPRQADTNPKDGWMKTESLLEFVKPTGTLEVNAGLALQHVFAGKCGQVDHHAESASSSSWGGINSPWVWTLKGPSRSRWRSSPSFHKYVSEPLTPGVVQAGGYCWDHGSGSTLFVALTYFPAKELATRARAIQSSYPITTKGLHTLENQTRTGFAAGPPAVGCP